MVTPQTNNIINQLANSMVCGTLRFNAVFISALQRIFSKRSSRTEKLTISANITKLLSSKYAVYKNSCCYYILSVVLHGTNIIKGPFRKRL